MIKCFPASECTPVPGSLLRDGWHVPAPARLCDSVQLLIKSSAPLLTRSSIVHILFGSCRAIHLRESIPSLDTRSLLQLCFPSAPISGISFCFFGRKLAASSCLSFPDLLSDVTLRSISLSKLLQSLIDIYFPSVFETC